MKTHTKLSLIILVVGMLVTLGWRFLEPELREQEQARTSDASGKKGTVVIGMDGWIGYFPLCSPEMKKRMYRVGYGLRCVDDAANYQDRYAKLKQGDYQFAVGTADSYLLNGERYDYPGAIVTVIDESKGGDAILARESIISSIEDLKSSTGVKVAFTPDSPSHHLLKALSTHFDIPSLRDKQRHLLSEGSEAALKALLDKQVDVAVVWEPEVTKGLGEQGIVRLLGTEDTQQLIVDILIASSRTISREPELVKLLLREYFRTLKHYRDNPKELIDDIRSNYDLSKAQAEALLQGVQWATLSDNARNWFGVVQQGYADQAIIYSIESALDVLLQHQDFDQNPVPDEDPYRLINSQFVSELNSLFDTTAGLSPLATQAKGKDPLFTTLTAAQWEQLETVGSLKTRDIVFVSGTSELTREGKIQIDQQMADLKHYPNFRVEIRGHSGLRGDKTANQILSQDRADSVLRYIEITHGIDDHRARSIGLGSSQPLTRHPGESNRAYNYRLPRVEIKLVRETI